MTDIAWRPSNRHLEKSNVARFLQEYGYSNTTDLVPGTEQEVAQLWIDMVDDVGIVWREPYETVLDTSDGVEYADWFGGGRLNAVETILDQWVEQTPGRVMYIWEDEDGNRDTLTYQQVANRSNKLANALRKHNVGQGDAVGITFPMHPNGFVASLACLRIGAVFTQIFPGYGADAIGQRLADSGAELVICADGYVHGGSETDLIGKVDEAIKMAPDVADVVVYDHCGIETDLKSAIVHDWEAFIRGQSTAAETEILDADETALFAYSSGTTGEPKGTIHSHASIVAMGCKSAKYSFDVSEDDTWMWITDFGWVIVPLWMLSGAPALGASTVLLEGGPAHPDDNRVWSAIKRYDVTTFGISPSGARGLRQLNDSPRTDHDLSSLQILGSTGEPWDEDGWRWFLESVGNGEAPIINASGGTELFGAILGPTPNVPLKPGTLYGPAPGVAANIYDESGTPTDEGYLVVEQPFPGMTNGLTAGDERYIGEYWSNFEGVWNQNDWALRDEDGFWFITGRADDTMNIAGRRITAPKIEEVITGHSAVSEATVIPQPDETKGQVPIAFVTLLSNRDGDGIEENIVDLVTDELGAPFRPADVYIVPGLPRTQTGKIPRGVIESRYLGEKAGNTSTLEGAEFLESLPAKEE